MDNKEVIKIDISQIPKLHLSEEDVLSSKPQRIERRDKLINAVKLNTQSPSPATITLRCKDRGLFELTSVILLVSKKFLSLKGGQSIPISSIVSIVLL